ncbi:MAG: protein kinase [Deltaproteobacteria bacterium]|nr:protein kinase [Deltaproteobacteria bacterium]
MMAECPHCLEVVPALEGACPRCRQDLAAQPGADPLIGKIVAENFEILELLGIGAMGRVFRARQISLDKVVAIKVLHRHLVGDPKLAKRFHREARAASRLNSPNSLQIIDFGQAADGTLYIAMEYLEGESLADLIERDFPFSPARIHRILAQVCDALDEAHEAGIIHRDLKPENILVTARRGEADFVKVCDFGIAKIQDTKAEDTDAQITMAGLVCGTPEYMSPEQARGDPLDGRTDVYAVGVIAYQMVTGKLPFSAETALGVITKHITEAVVPPTRSRPDLQIPGELEAVVLRAMSKNREDRQASAGDLKRELAAALARIADPSRRHPSKDVLPVAPPARTIMSGEIEGLPGRRGTRWRLAAVVLGGLLFATGGYLALRASAPRPGAPRLHSDLGPAPSRPPAGPVSRDSTGGATVAADAAQSAAEVPDAAAPPAAVAGPDAAVPPAEPRPPRSSKLAQKSARPAPVQPPPQAGDPGRAAFEEGRRLFQTSQYQQAIAKYREAERHGYGGVALYRALGQAHARLGNVPAMCDAYRRVLRASPGDVIVKGIVGAQCPD